MYFLFMPVLSKNFLNEGENLADVSQSLVSRPRLVIISRWARQISDGH